MIFLKFSPFFLFFLVSLFLFSTLSMVGAVDDEFERIESVLSTELENSSSDVGIIPSSGIGGVLSGSLSPSSDLTLKDVQILRSVAPVGPADDGSLKSVLLSLIGDYDPIVLEYSYQSSNGYTSYIREVQYDYPWLAAALLFIVVLWCVFRIGGRVIWNR